MQNETQYDLDRKAAKISALSSNNLDKYEYLTGEDLSLKPNTIEQARFEYSPLGEIFNKVLDKDDKKEGLFKRLENITNKDEEQLQAIKAQGEEQFKKLKNIEESKTLKVINGLAKKMIKQIRYYLTLKKNDELDTAELFCTKTDETKYDFDRFSSPFKFVAKIYNYEITLEEAMDNKKKLENLISKLKIYEAKN